MLVSIVRLHSGVQRPGRRALYYSFKLYLITLVLWLQVSQRTHLLSNCTGLPSDSRWAVYSEWPSTRPRPARHDVRVLGDQALAQCAGYSLNRVCSRPSESASKAIAHVVQAAWRSSGTRSLLQRDSSQGVQPPNGSRSPVPARSSLPYMHCDDFSVDSFSFVDTAVFSAVAFHVEFSSESTYSQSTPHHESERCLCVPQK
jgi:hypothetical protein